MLSGKERREVAFYADGYVEVGYDVYVRVKCEFGASFVFHRERPWVYYARKDKVEEVSGRSSGDVEEDTTLN